MPPGEDKLVADFVVSVESTKGICYLRADILLAVAARLQSHESQTAYLEAINRQRGEIIESLQKQRAKGTG